MAMQLLQLPLSDLLTIPLVCRDFYNICREPWFWRLKYRMHHPDGPESDAPKQDLYNRLYKFGENSDGQLGHPPADEYLSLTYDPMPNIHKVYAVNNVSALLDCHGGVWFAGNNNYCLLFGMDIDQDDSEITKFTRIDIPKKIRDVVLLSVNVCLGIVFLDVDGVVWASGQLTRSRLLRGPTIIYQQEPIRSIHHDGSGGLIMFTDSGQCIIINEHLKPELADRLSKIKIKKIQGIFFGILYYTDENNDLYELNGIMSTSVSVMEPKLLSRVVDFACSHIGLAYISMDRDICIVERDYRNGVTTTIKSGYQPKKIYAKADVYAFIDEQDHAYIIRLPYGRYRRHTDPVDLIRGYKIRTMAIGGSRCPPDFYDSPHFLFLGYPI